MLYNDISTKSYDSNYYELVEEENYKIKKSNPFDKLTNYFDIQKSNHINGINLL